MKDLPFGPIGSFRTPAQWALMHAGLEFLAKRDREIVWLKAEGLEIETLATRLGIPEIEIERSLDRTARTLATWERNACKWATRYVAREPMAQAPGASPESDIRRSDGLVEG